MKRALSLLLLTALTFSFAQTTHADDEETVPQSILFDHNGDGLVTIAAFGDSITRGEGDFQSSPTATEEAIDPGGREASYPLRIESFLGIPVSNWGFSGEALTQGGEARFLSLIHNRPDIVIIAEGSNDGRIPASPSQMYRALQKMINASRALDVEPVLTTLVPACCGHQFLQRFLDSYNPDIRTLATVNDVRLSDADHAFRNSCDLNSCYLLTRPEGLHPDIQGYDVMGEAAISALLGINIFAPDGPTLYAQALGIDPTQVRTVPDPLPPPQ